LFLIQELILKLKTISLNLEFRITNQMSGHEKSFEILLTWGWTWFWYRIQHQLYCL